MDASSATVKSHERSSSLVRPKGPGTSLCEHSSAITRNIVCITSRYVSTMPDAYHSHVMFYV